MKLSTAGVIAVLLVIAAVAVGLLAGTVARPAPATPRRATPTPVVATATPQPTTDPNVFKQPLSSGCVTSQSMWVVTNGGGLVRYDGENWLQVDGTLRSLVYAACDADLLYAVGPAGAVLTVDDRSRQIRAVDVTTQDLLGIAPLPDGAIAVGTQGTVMRLTGGNWQPYARGIDEELRAIVAFSGESAWAVGVAGIAYRLEPAGWRPVPTGVDTTLRAVTGPNVGSVLAAGDAGTVIVLSGGRWNQVDSGVEETLRAATRSGTTAWIVGDGGVVLAVESVFVSPTVPAKPPATRRIDIATACDLTSVFVRGDDLWIIGSTSGGAGVWRLRNGSVAQHWGAC